MSERVDPELTTLDELCPGEGGLPDLPEGFDETMTVGGVVAEAEAELLTEEPDDALLEEWKDVIDFINNTTVGPDCIDEGESDLQLRRSEGRRQGRH